MNHTKAVLVAATAAGLAVGVAAYGTDADPKTPQTPARTMETDAQAAAKANPVIKVDAPADALLRKMSNDLAALKSFSFDAEHVTEMITTEGQRLQVLASSTVVVQRPNLLRSERKGPLGDVTIYYDGHKLSVHGKTAQLYATTPAPATLDDAIDFARDDLNLDTPAADLLYTDPYSMLMEDVVTGAYIDDAVIAGRVCKHLAFRGSLTDWEIWIEDGKRALPCRFVITSKDVKGWPQYSVALTNWRATRALPAKHFAFTPPRGAAKIEFLTIAASQTEQVQP